MKPRFRKASTIALLTATATFAGCVDNEKNFYDPTFRTESPMGEVVAPEGFDWQLSNTVNLIVNAADEYNGQYYYIIEVFDENPVTSADARLLEKGVAKQGQPFVTELSVSKAVPTIYIRQTTPTGLATIRAYETANGRIDCHFGTSSPSTRSMAMTRGSTDINVPDTDDAAIFPQSVPKEAKLYQGWGMQNGESYEVRSNITQINLGGVQNVKLYVSQNIDLTEEFYLTQGSTLYILPGVTVTMPQSTNNGQANCMVSIGKGSSFKSTGNVQIDRNFKFYNLGTVTANNLVYSNASFFYNKGTVTIANKLNGTVTGSIFLNEGNVTTKEFEISSGSRVVNRNQMTVQALTHITSSNDSWENDGNWTTENMTIQAWNDFCINKCKLIVNQLLSLTETNLINDAGAYIQCNNLYMNNTKIQLGAQSLFVVKAQAKYGYQTKEHGFKGTGDKKALLVIEEAVAQELKANLIHYSGNLQVVCEKHPVERLNDSNIYWTLTNGAEWAKKATATVQIPKSECNEGFGTNPTPPTNPKFPLIVESGEKHSLLFEDQWPLYGDYDMNDIVMELKGLKYALNEKNSTDEFQFTVTLEAVGAERPIAAAVMLDKISASNVESIEYDGSPRPTTFSTTSSGVEEGQQYAVIPLFDDAHKWMGKSDRRFINTQSGSNNNVPTGQLPEVEITIKLKKEVSKSAFNINNMNFFLITDKAEKRKEVHMAGYKPTDRANTTLFGGNDDGSSLSISKYYVSKENLSWGIIVPQQFKWPLEYHNIKDVYSEFQGWVTSGGVNNTKWYNTFDNTKTFQNNKN